MLDTFVEDLKMVLLKPHEAFKKAKGTTLGAVYRFYVTLLIIFTVLLGIVAVSIGVTTFSQVVSQLANVPVFGGLISGGLAKFIPFVIAWEVFSVYMVFLCLLFSVFIGGLILHVFVLLVGGEKGVVQTIKTNMYAAAPFLLLGWIPYISIIGAIWSIVLFILGIEETQEISLGKALMVVLIPVILGLILAGLGSAVIVSFFDAVFELLPKRF